MSGLWRIGGALGLAVLMLALAPPVRAGIAPPCQGRIGPQTGIDGRTAYDPFAPTDLTDSYRLLVVNTGGGPCAFAVVMRTASPRPVLGGALAYDIVSPAGTSLLAGAPGQNAPALRLTAPLPAFGEGRLDFAITLARGQPAAPGTYRDSAALELYALDESGRLGAAPLQRATLAIAYTVPRVLSVNIKGAELATTLGFGVLESGQQRSVAIQARSNLSYELGVSSDNRGSLALRPAVAGEDWRVPYEARLGGQPLDLTAGTVLRALPPTRPDSDATFPLTVTIGEVGRKRAGRYEDVITVEIRGAVP